MLEFFWIEENHIHFGDPKKKIACPRLVDSGLA